MVYTLNKLFESQININKVKPTIPGTHTQIILGLLYANTVKSVCLQYTLRNVGLVDFFTVTTFSKEYPSSGYCETLLQTM